MYFSTFAQRSSSWISLWLSYFLYEIPYHSYHSTLTSKDSSPTYGRPALRSMFRTICPLLWFITLIWEASRSHTNVIRYSDSDDTLSFVRLPLFDLVRQQLLSFTEFGTYMGNHLHPFSRLRSWSNPADAVVAWWRSSLPHSLVSFLCTRTDYELL